jgi:uncharacterized repeat protein (TIGR03803 family)
LMATDGALYGTTVFGGNFGLGTVYRFGHELSLFKSANRADLSITGIMGYSYLLQRSTNLSTWKLLGTFLVPDNALVRYADSNSPPIAAFYRILAP